MCQVFQAGDCAYRTPKASWRLGRRGDRKPPVTPHKVERALEGRRNRGVISDALPGLGTHIRNAPVACGCRGGLISTEPPGTQQTDAATTLSTYARRPCHRCD